MLFILKNNWLGTLLITGMMVGAIMGHLTKLGINHNNDNGLLFTSAVITFISGTILLFLYRTDIPITGKKL